METEGFLRPETPAAARRAHAELLPGARTVVTEAARAMDFDRAEMDARLDEDVYRTAHDAMFASVLEVRVGDAEAFADWREDYGGELTVNGSENVENVVWHAAPAVDAAVAATFQNERAAAVATLRRQAYGDLYREVLADA
jgi:hypothetical protein